jgi:hypothetical protein
MVENFSAESEIHKIGTWPKSPRESARMIGMLWLLFWDMNDFVGMNAFESFLPGPNPTIVTHSASAVKLFSPTNSQVRIENEHIFFYFKICSSLVVVVNFEVVGLDPGFRV